MISALDSVSSLIAENALSSTQTSLSSTLQDLSTGLSINSGSENPAGLSIADGLGANIAALTQSTQNATNGVGLLQTADGALSQVTTLLNQAVTIATEASNGDLTSAQSAAANTEFQSILSEIDQVGNTTNFNGEGVFSITPQTVFTSDGTSAGSTTTSVITGNLSAVALNLGGQPIETTSGGGLSDTTAIAATDTFTITPTTGTAYTYTAPTGGGTVQDLMNGINASGLGTASLNSSGNLVISGLASGTTVSSTDAALSMTSGTAPALDLLSSSDAQTALTAITAAIAQVAATRGSIGATVNQLTADEGVETTEVQNLTSAQNNIQDADVGSTVSQMTDYSVLQQTGMAALSESETVQQTMLKLVQNL